MSGDSAAHDDSTTSSSVFLQRLAAAVIQAALLWWLTSLAATSPLSWPATEPQLFEPLLLAFAYGPLIIVVGAGQVRLRPLLIWAAIAAAAVAGLGFHDVDRLGTPAHPPEGETWPSYRLVLTLSASLFVAHVLVIDAIIERRLIPSYRRHFDTAWKLGVQVVMATVFVALFWAMLFLAAGLFKLVDLDFFDRLIHHHWFSVPATALAIAAALHVTDVQPSLLRGARSLALALFSWLLPLFAAILLSFLCSLPFISLAPLWRSQMAARLLLYAAVAVVFLVNCGRQDGAPERDTSRIKRLAGMVASFELVFLVGLAAWALAQRVEQYGWTVDRILAAAVAVIALCYAVGYLAATLVVPFRQKLFEITNFATAGVALALFLILFSSVADPARLMVANQVARLKSGAVRPEEFDFITLKLDGGRWGADALTKLSQTKDGADATTIAEGAALALKRMSRWPGRDSPILTIEEMADHVAVYPVGRALPAAFFDKGFWPPGGRSPLCLDAGPRKCFARFVVLQPGSPEAIIFFDEVGGHLFEQDPSGQWRQTAELLDNSRCHRARQGIERGEFRIEPHNWPDLVAGDHHFVASPLDSVVCPRD